MYSIRNSNLIHGKYQVLVALSYFAKNQYIPMMQIFVDTL